MVASTPIVQQNKLSMISTALVLCGEKPLQSINDTRYGASVGASIFDMVYENELTSNPWRITCTKGQISQINAAPANEWQYVFQMPTDALAVIGFYGIGPDRSFDIYGGKLYTNMNSGPGPVGGSGRVLILEYQFKPDPSYLPSYLSLLVTLALAKRMIKPITESDSAQTKMEQAYNQQRNIAMATDAKQRPNRPLQSMPFVSVR